MNDAPLATEMSANSFSGICWPPGVGTRMLPISSGLSRYCRSRRTTKSNCFSFCTNCVATSPPMAVVIRPLMSATFTPRIRVLAFLLMDEREHFVRDGRAVVVVAALEQEHGVEGLARRLTLAHAGGHRLAGGFGGSGGGGSAATEKAGNEREESGQEELAAAART